MKIHYMVWMGLSCSALIYGEYLSKLYANNPSWRLMIGATLVYGLCGLLWLPALTQRNQLVIMGAVWDIMGVIGVLFLGLVVFKEQLSPTNYAGVGLGVISLVLLLW